MLLSTGMIPRSRFSTAENLVNAARSADAAGLTRVWMGDRLVYPAHYESAGDLGREFPWDIQAPQLEGIVAMTWMLAATTRVKVGISVMVLPLRHPVQLARQVASLDSLSGGRVTLGVGIGGVLEEFDCAGVDRRRRGPRCEEYVRALQVLWTEERPSFSGEFISFPELYCNPKPVQAGGIPLWFGGHSPETYDRVVRLGAGLAAGSTPPARAAELAAVLRQRAEALGRDPSSVGLMVVADHPERDSLRRLLDEHREAGVTEVVVPPHGRTPAEVADSIAAIPELAP
jgi:probable F420-dependent oxidoreductase